MTNTSQAIEQEQAPLLSQVLAALREIPEGHRPESETYKLLSAVVERGIAELPLRSPQAIEFSFPPFGSLVFPYFKMGAIDTTHLFGVDELIIFAFYVANCKHYARVADLGANVGLHSVLLAKLGYHVSSYEPDPLHFAKLTENVVGNGVSAQVSLNQAAIADKEGTLEFVRVVGNTTSSHLSGAKSNAYGTLERFPVKTVALSQVMRNHDLIKMDIEGYEATALLATTALDWARCDVMLEVGSPENAEKIWNHLGKLSLRCFVQQCGWRRAESLADIPTSYRGGSIFVTTKDQMVW